MNCWHCKSDLIWGGDHSFEDHGMEGEGIVSNLSCQNCPTFVLVYFDIDKDNKDKWRSLSPGMNNCATLNVTIVTKKRNFCYHNIRWTTRTIK